MYWDANIDVNVSILNETRTPNWHLFVLDMPISKEYILCVHFI